MTLLEKDRKIEAYRVLEAMGETADYYHSLARLYRIHLQDEEQARKYDKHARATEQSLATRAHEFVAQRAITKAQAISAGITANRHRALMNAAKNFSEWHPGVIK